MARKSPELVDVQVGKLVRLRRQQKGMSQSELGTAIGVTFQQVQKYERGANRLSSSRLQSVAHILKVPVSYFFEDPSKSVSEQDWPAEVDKFFATQEGRSLAGALMSIENRKMRKAICKLVEQLAEQRDRG